MFLFEGEEVRNIFLKESIWSVQEKTKSGEEKAGKYLVCGGEKSGDGKGGKYLKREKYW